MVIQPLSLSLSLSPPLHLTSKRSCPMSYSSCDAFLYQCLLANSVALLWSLVSPSFSHYSLSTITTTSICLEYAILWSPFFYDVLQSLTQPHLSTLVIVLWLLVQPFSNYIGHLQALIYYWQSSFTIANIYLLHFISHQAQYILYLIWSYLLFYIKILYFQT